MAPFHARITSQYCPYVANQLETVEGWQAWELIETCSGQLRTAGMGGIIGFDLPAFLQVADALGYERKSLISLLSFAESGMLEAMRERSESSES